MSACSRRNLYDEQGACIELATVNIRHERRFDRIAADLDNQHLDLVKLCPAHQLNIAVVGDATQQRSAQSVGESSDLIREVVA